MTEKIIDVKKELEVIERLSRVLISSGYNAKNSVILTVSMDYSSIAGQMLRHFLSHDGEIADGFGVDVPYPDEYWDPEYVRELQNVFTANMHLLNGKVPILVEAGVIRGGNYEFLVGWMKNNLYLPNGIKTLAMYENTGSRFKSDFVGEYYDATAEDLTFWWEKYNRHWK